MYWHDFVTTGAFGRQRLCDLACQQGTRVFRYADPADRARFGLVGLAIPCPSHGWDEWIVEDYADPGVRAEVDPYLVVAVLSGVGQPSPEGRPTTMATTHD